MYGGGAQSRWGGNSQAAAFTDPYEPKASRARSMRGVKASMNDCISAGATVFESRNWCGCCTRWLICIFTLALAAAAGTGAWLAYHNLHLRFWLAHLIYLALITLAVALALTFFSFAYKAYVTTQRQWMRDRKSYGVTANSQDWKEPLSMTTLRTIFFLVFLMACCSVVAGGCVLQFGGAMEVQLLHNCGKSGTTHFLEAAYVGLSEFHEKCTADPKHKDKPINECPGYKPAEPAYAGYMKYLEATSGCMGFCTIAKKPLFAVPDDGVAKNLSCSTYVANYVWTASLVVGVTNTVIGVCLFCLSVSLLCYDHF